MGGNSHSQLTKEAMSASGLLEATSPSTAALARKALQRRAFRLRRFRAELACDGVWNMLLELMAAKAEGRNVPIKCLWVASGAPQSTALRWINQLENAGHVTRSGDERDRRRQFIHIDEELAMRVAAFLEESEA